MGKLVLHLPDGSTRDLHLTRERMTIGRRADNDICLPLPTVSAEHAAVVTVLDDSFLEDLGSRNGTLVNGKEIRKHFLREGDEIDIGHQRLVYVSGVFEAADPASLSPAEGVLGRATSPSEPRKRTHFAGVASDGPGESGTAPDAPAMIDTAALFAEPEEAGAGQPQVRSDAPTLEIVDGPGAGRQVVVDRDEFVIGRVGVQIAAIRRTADGYRLVLLEGEVAPSINGAALPREGALLALGDEIGIAGTRIRYRPA